MRPCLPFVLIVGTVAACGGGQTGPNPPPSPPAPGAPATVSVQAGDAQSGPPAGTLSVAPAVLVRDPANRPVPNVAVTFAVDSGGGSLATTQATTGADGVAQGGAWTLGPAEGRNVVKATVGSLPPARFVALARVPDIDLPAADVGLAGGTVTLNRPGSPLDGTTLRIAPGALAAATAVSFTIRSSADIALRDSVLNPSPLLVIATTAGALTEPALVRIPRPVTAGHVRAVMVRDNPTAPFRLLSTVAADAGSITVALPDIAPPAASAAPGAVTAPAAASGIELLLVDLMKLWTMTDFDTGFRPGVDDWDFRRQPVAALPNVTGPDVDPAQAMLGTALWYWRNQKQTGAPALWGRFQEVNGIPESNRRGLRWVGLTGPVFTALWTSSLATTTAMSTAAQQPSSPYAASIQTVISQMRGFAQTYGPVPVLLVSGTAADAPRLALAFRSQNKVVDLAIPDQPGQTFHAAFDDDGVMTPFPVTSAGGGVYTVTNLMPASFLNRLIETRLAGEWPRVVNGTIGDAEGWPQAELRASGLTTSGNATVDADPEDFVIGPSVTHWWRCPGCRDYGFAAAGTEAKLLVWRRVARDPAGTWGPLPPALFDQALFSAQSLVPALASTSGFALYRPGPGSGTGSAVAPAWLDWRTINYRRLPTSVTPVDPLVIDVTDFTFTGSATNPPAGVRYRWSLDNGATPVPPVETPNPTFQATIDRPGDTYVIFEVVQDPGGRIIAVDTTKVTYEERPLAIDPTPLNGSFDTDYQLTATYGRALPAQPSWVWDLGDGRVVTTQTPQVTVRYPAPVPLTEKSYPLKLTLKSGTATEAVTRMTVVMGAPIYTAWRIRTRATVTVSDTRAIDNQVIWNDFVQNHHIRAGWQPVWDAYRADSAFLFSPQTTNSAVALVARDTLFGGAFPANAGYLRSMYWWTYGSYPTSAATPISMGLKGTSNTMVRGGTSCDASLSSRFAQTGTTTAGSVTGQNWIHRLTLIDQTIEPLVIFSYQVTFQGDVATGTIWQTYRLTTDCLNPAVTWTFATDFTADRVR